MSLANLLKRSERLHDWKYTEFSNINAETPEEFLLKVDLHSYYERLGLSDHGISDPPNDGTEIVILLITEMLHNQFNLEDLILFIRPDLCYAERSELSNMYHSYLNREQQISYIYNSLHSCSHLWGSGDVSNRGASTELLISFFSNIDDDKRVRLWERFQMFHFANILIWTIEESDTIYMAPNPNLSENTNDVLKLLV